jgi:hypothetical protein
MLPYEIAGKTAQLLESKVKNGWAEAYRAENLAEVFFGDDEETEELRETFEIACEGEPGAIIEISGKNQVFWDETDACFRPSRDDELTSLNWRFCFIHEKGYTAMIDFDDDARLRPLFPTPDHQTLATSIDSSSTMAKETANHIPFQTCVWVCDTHNRRCPRIFADKKART